MISLYHCNTYVHFRILINNMDSFHSCKIRTAVPMIFHLIFFFSQLIDRAVWNCNIHSGQILIPLFFFCRRDFHKPSPTSKRSVCLSVMVWRRQASIKTKQVFFTALLFIRFFWLAKVWPAFPLKITTLIKQLLTHNCAIPKKRHIIHREKQNCCTCFIQKGIMPTQLCVLCYSMLPMQQWSKC